jgi:hypothetical protein
MTVASGPCIAASIIVEARLEKDRQDKDQTHAEVAGIYVNHLAIGHNLSEIVMDFSQAFDAEKPRKKARLITSPTHMRSFQALMAETIERYEDEFGLLASVNTKGQEN